MTSTQRFDVVIVGSGITGSILAAILSRNGVRTLLLERGVHPRFAIGESTVPETTFQFGLLAERFGVPEVGHLGTFNKLQRNITTTCGVKRNFSFAFHRQGEEHRANECCQMPTLSPPLGPDMHMFRQDVDAYLITVAASYGATVRQQTEVSSIDIGECVRVETKQGDAIEAEFIVDAGGIQAPVAKALGLRESPPPLETHSRSMFTHMLGVRPFDACTAPQREHGLPSPFSQGTLHHLFEGGWLWVIPFDNHPSSTNRLCSVGLTLDPRVHPPTELSPEAEFRSFIGRFPSIARQFEGAQAIRDWIRAPRIQFWSKACAGERFCLMPHAFSFIDPLFSSGLSVSLAALNMLAARLIEAKGDGDYSAKRFEAIDERVKRDFRYVDRLISRSYVAFSNFELWNAWYRVWALGTVFGSVGTLEGLARFERTGDPESFAMLEQPPYGGVLASQLPEMATLFDAAVALVDEVAAGTLEPAEAARGIFARIDESGFWPDAWGPVSGEVRHPGIFTIPQLVPFVRWVQTKSPEALRNHYYKEVGPKQLVAALSREWGSELARSGRSVAVLARDILRGYNRDWANRNI